MTNSATVAQALSNPKIFPEILAELRGISFDPAAPGLRLAIGPCTVTLRSNSPHLLDQVGRYFKAYLSEGPSDGELYVELSGHPELWGSEDAEFHFKNTPDGLLVFQRDFCALRDGGKNAKSGERAVALLGPEVDDAYHNLLRWFASTLLIRKNALLLHGSGIVRDGNGYVFFGQSGAGKTTSVGLIEERDPDALVIGDDVLIIEAAQTGPVLHTAPLGSGYTHEPPPRRRVPIAGLFALQQDSEDRIEGVPPAEQLARLTGSAMAGFFEENGAAALELAARIVGESPSGVKKLHFRKSADFWKLILRMNSGSGSRSNKENSHVVNS